MASLNRITLIGNLGTAPKEHTLEGDRKMVSFTLATSSAYADKQGKKQESTEWHDIVAFGKVAEICMKFLKKGSRVYLEGAMHYKSREVDQVKFKQASVNVGKLIMLDAKANGKAIDATGAPEGDLPF